MNPRLNAALYSSNSTFPTGDSVRKIGLLVGLMLCAVGCDPATSKPGAQGDKPAAASKAAVPLRIWFVANPEEKQLIERQWQAGSERPLDLRMISSQELLNSPKCECDLVVYPAHLLGEFIHRDWLAELPSSLQNPSSPSTRSATRSNATSSAESASRESSEDSNSAVNKPAAWIDQTRFGGRLWGLSLGATTPIVMTNFALPKEWTSTGAGAVEPLAFWKSVLESMSKASSAPTAAKSGQGADDKPTHDPGAIHPETLCDRFLVIALSVSRREPRFGFLLDPESLKCRLADSEFVEAARILAELHRHNSKPQALMGDSTTAWNALAMSETACVTIGTPPVTSPEVDKVTNIFSCSPPTNLTMGSAATPAARSTTGWNSGHGLVVSLSNQCRQTAQAVEFSKWLSGETTRNILGKRIEGIVADNAYAPSSSAWQIQRTAARLVQQPRLPAEPRIVASHKYRRSLGEHLGRMLQGDSDAEQTMKAAAAAWDAITADSNRKELRSNFEQSLGL